MNGASDDIEAGGSSPDTAAVTSSEELPPEGSETREDASVLPEPAADVDPEDQEQKNEAHEKQARKKWRREPGLALSYRKGLPIEGRVEQVIRGGYEIRVGRARGFCPHSLMDVRHVENPEEHVGRTYLFKAIQLRRGGEEVILSRRALLDEERSEEAKAVRATLVEGSIMQGRVARIADFGVFVDLGAGVTGLVHVSEASHTRVPSLENMLKPGETVQVKILKLDEATGRISLSMRQAQEDPWTTAAARLPAGSVHHGTIRRLAEFGAFVEMLPGVEALAASDGFPPVATGWQEGLAEGAERDWRILSVDPVRRRISIQPVEAGGSESPQQLEPGTKLRGRVQKVERFGVFVWLGPGRVGLLPNAYSGTRKGTDLTRTFPPGKEIEVEVLEVGADGHRVRLTIPGVTVKPPEPRPERPAKRDREREAARSRPGEGTGAPAATTSSGFGTSLGDALREAFKKSSEKS